MLAILLTWTSGDVIEVAVTGVLVVVLMCAFATIPFIAEYYVDDRRREPSPAAKTPGDEAE